MTSNTHNLHSYGNLYELSPEAIEKRLKWMIQYYLHTRSPAVARGVVSHIERLCRHPDYAGDNRERCAYLRLRTHWRWLASPTINGRGA